MFYPPGLVSASHAHSGGRTRQDEQGVVPMLLVLAGPGWIENKPFAGNGTRIGPSNR
jgi:hypothetical protein